jgi:hypothetical protein
VITCDHVPIVSRALSKSIEIPMTDFRVRLPVHWSDDGNCSRDTMTSWPSEPE